MGIIDSGNHLDGRESKSVGRGCRGNVRLRRVSRNNDDGSDVGIDGWIDDVGSGVSSDGLILSALTSFGADVS